MLSSTPSSRRDRAQPPSTQTQNGPPLPPYEPPIAPLLPADQRALAALLQSHSLRHLKTHIQHAGEKLTDSAGEVNERLTEARVRYEKEKRRKNNNNSTDSDGRSPTAGGDNDEDGESGGGVEGEMNRLSKLEDRVGTITGKLEERMRGVVDAEVKLDKMTGILTRLGREAEEASINGPSSSTRRPTRRRRRNDDDEEGENEEDEDEDEDYEATPEREARARDVAPSRKLDTHLSEDYAHWDDLSLTDRYSTNNTYIGFYRIVHEAKHPGDDIPPLPHASTWFRHMEDPSTANNSNSTANNNRRTRRRDPSPAESDDLAIASERISLKCPLTLLTFKDPVTSRKCPHSFEKEAILGMISTSQTTVPAPQGSRQRRVRSVKCPVCSELLTAEDLRSDPVLLRRVRRAEAAEQQYDDDDDDEEDEGGHRSKRSKGGRKSGITVASDDEDEDEDEDEMDVDDDSNGERSAQPDMVRVKQEQVMSQRMSTAPDEMDDDED